MTYQTLLQAQSVLSGLDQHEMGVDAKVTVYRLLQYAEGELQTYQQTLQSITPSHVETLADLNDEEQEEVSKLLNKRVEEAPQSKLTQAELPDSISVQEIAALDQAGMLSLNEGKG